ncbi:MAG: hypothetical protein IJZ53_13110 [Tyzzerella sp.]|nr:hypothetical protein [Tyzzerella sp.]
MIYEKMLSESQRLGQQIDSLQSQIQDFPEGKLICSSNGSRIKWRQSDGHESVYIPKGNRQLAEQLAHKKYLSLQLKNMAQEKKAIDFYLRHHDSNAPYKKNDSHPENLIIETHSGNIVRSKSEMLIDMFLFKNKIPFRYEYQLELNDIIPSIQLITTFETKKSPLTAENVERIVQQYFL